MLEPEGLTEKGKIHPLLPSAMALLLLVFSPPAPTFLTCPYVFPHTLDLFPDYLTHCLPFPTCSPPLLLPSLSLTILPLFLSWKWFCTQLCPAGQSHELVACRLFAVSLLLQLALASHVCKVPTNNYG